MVFKVSDGDDTAVYLEHEENVMAVVGGFVDYAEPNQKMVVETVVVKREELNTLPRGI